MAIARFKQSSMSIADTSNFYDYRQAQAYIFFLLFCRKISIEEIPKSGITKSKTINVKMLTVYLKIGLENTSN